MRVRLWRGHGVRCVLHIDDGIVMVQGREKRQTSSAVLQRNR